MRPCLLAAAAMVGLAAIAEAAPTISHVNLIAIAGDATDLHPGANAPNSNRLGGFFSDLHYDRATGASPFNGLNPPLLNGIDNDFSVTQTGSGDQSDVCVNAGNGQSPTVALGGICPAGTALLPTHLFAFKVSGDIAYTAPIRDVPEPASLALPGGGLPGLAVVRRAR